MNFGRILNIFILLFIVINIVLAGLYEYKQQDKYTLSNERKELLREILGENDIAVYTLLPNFYRRRKINVEPVSINTDSYPQNFFKDGYTLKPLEKRYIKGYESIIILDSKKIAYEKVGQAVIENFNEDTVRKIGHELMGRLTMGKGKMVLTSSLPSDDDTYYRLIFNDRVGGDDVLFMSYVELTIYKNGNIEGHSERYRVTESIEDKKQITPIDEVLYRFMNNIRLAENNESIYIKGIDIGYYKDVDREMSSTRSIVTAVPCYRIRLDNGMFYYIDAYTNRELALGDGLGQHE